MADLQTALARAYISEAIKNSSASIKACWTIVFTAATIGALKPMTDVARCALQIADANSYQERMASEISKSCADFHSQALWITTCLVIIYFATFIRFYLGGIRVFDVKYSEMFSLVNVEISLASNSQFKSVDTHLAAQRLDKALSRFVDILSYNDTTRYKIEVFWLLIQSLIVVSLAYDIIYPRLFMETYICLIFMNSMYLFISIKVSHKAITNLEQEVFPEWNAHDSVRYDRRTREALVAANLPNDAALKWACNNLFHSSLMFIYMKSYPNPAASLLIVYCTTNILFDFVLTQNFYFPKFKQKYEVLQPKRETSDFDI